MMLYSKIAGIYYSIRSFGIGQTLGIDISGEPFPMIKNVGQDGWSGLTLPQIGYWL